MANGNDLPCPNCGIDNIRILESRPATYRGVEAKRRRRECTRCGHRWSTREIAESDLNGMIKAQEDLEKQLRSLRVVNQKISECLANSGGFLIPPKPKSPKTDQA